MKNILILIVLISFISACKEDSSSFPASADGGGTTGTGGSMAKYTFSGNYLYTVEKQFLTVYDVTNAKDPQKLTSIDLNNNGVETIFPYGEYLFFGTQNGMLIYSLSNPERPSYISTYTHIVSCDPVVVSGNIAYVTLSTGNRCNRGVNQLELIDISNIQQPRLIRAYQYVNPKGLAIAGDYLYLCDGSAGLKILDVKNPNNVKMIKQIDLFDTYDVIKKGDILTITGLDGIYQYDCSDPINLKFLSKISSVK
jgi:hypothetical protein